MYLKAVLADERAHGIRVDASRIAELERLNRESLDDLAKNGRVPVEA